MGLFENVKPNVGLLEFAINGSVHPSENLLQIHK